MKYKPSQYAESLYEVLENATEKNKPEIFRRFKNVLQKNGDLKLLNSILIRYEKLYLTKAGLRKVEVESASPLQDDVRKNIEKALGGKAMLTEKVNPQLLAGLTLLIDDSTFIDASGRSRIKKLFA